MVVAFAWGTDLIQFLAMLAILNPGDLKNKMYWNIIGCIHSILQIVLVQNS